MRSWIFRVVLLAAVAGGILGNGACCCTNTGIRTAAGGSQAGDLSKGCLLDDVQLIVITADGKTWPKQAKVRKGIQVVVWVADADALDIQWTSQNPFPVPPQCAGRFCYSIQPPNGTIGPYDYKGTITRGATSTVIDPRIEIMN